MRGRRIPWGVVFWAAAVAAGIEAAGIAWGEWVLTRPGMVLMCAGVAVFALMAWWHWSVRSDYEGRHSAATRARLIAEARAAAADLGPGWPEGVPEEYRRRYYEDDTMPGYPADWPGGER